MTSAGVLAACLVACGAEHEPKPEASPEPVVVLGPGDTVEARVGDIASGLVITGTLEPSEVVEIKAQVPGTIQDLAVDRGVPVRRGQRLAVIEAQGVRSQVSSARAGVAAAESQIAAAEANRAAAQQRLEGARVLHEAGALSTVDFQSVQAQYEAAVGQVAAARSQAAAAAAQLTAATETAGRTVVQAPIAGVVSRRDVNEGEAVNAGQALLTIVNSQTLELAGQIPVQQAARAHVGQAVSFTLDAYPNQEFTGEVARIDPVADPATRRVGIALQLPNADGRLVGGQFVTGQVLTANVAKAIVIPRTALRGDEKARFVFVVENGRIARRDVTVGALDDARGTVPVESGLNEGDRVIVSPATDIQAGALVRDAGGTQPAAGAP
jgi:RND family efflux transporter MFP subunit